MLCPGVAHARTGLYSTASVFENWLTVYWRVYSRWKAGDKSVVWPTSEYNMRQSHWPSRSACQSRMFTYAICVCVFKLFRVFRACTILSTNMGTYVRVLVKYALYYKQITRILLGTDIGGHCFSTSVNLLSTNVRTQGNKHQETKY
jgi:hypothetical protein